MHTPSFLRHWQPRYLKPVVLIGLTLVAYVAAVYRLQALPWALASLLLATLLVGYTWPYWLIRHLAVTRSGPTRAEEGESITFRVEVRNHGRLPRFMVEAVDSLPFVSVVAEGRRAGECVLGVVAYLAGGGVRQFEVTVECEKRGLYQLGPIGLATSFPLDLAEARQKKQGGVQWLTIYPDIFPILALPLLGTPSEINRGSLVLPQGAGSADFSGLREYRQGDSPRHIHWPTTARLGELMVREYEPLASASLYLALDYTAAANVGSGKHSSFEYAVRIAASIARYACDHDMPIRLAGAEGDRYAIDLGTGEAHFRDILDTLAVVDADSRVSYALSLQTVALHCRYGQTVVLFLSTPEAAVAETLQAIALLRAQGAHILALVFERDSFQGQPAQGNSPWRGLLDLGISCLTIRQGDDLMRLFNP